MTTRPLLCVLAVLLVGGAPASCDSSKRYGPVRMDEYCRENITSITERCDGKGAKPLTCVGVPAEFADGCKLGCVMSVCSDVYNCEQSFRRPEPFVQWCGTSCADLKGGHFWYYLTFDENSCRRHKTETEYLQPAMGDCITKRMEEHCPALAGTRWAAQFPSIYTLKHGHRQGM